MQHLHFFDYVSDSTASLLSVIANLTNMLCAIFPSCFFFLIKIVFKLWFISVNQLRNLIIENATKVEVALYCWKQLLLFTGVFLFALIGILYETILSFVLVAMTKQSSVFVADGGKSWISRWATANAVILVATTCLLSHTIINSSGSRGQLEEKQRSERH